LFTLSGKKHLEERLIRDKVIPKARRGGSLNLAFGWQVTKYGEFAAAQWLVEGVWRTAILLAYVAYVDQSLASLLYR
jgi:hypothetical protein